MPGWQKLYAELKDKNFEIVSVAEDTAGAKAAGSAIRAAKPDLVLVALGAPKQELWIDEASLEVGPAVLLGLGASLDFIAGTVDLR